MIKKYVKIILVVVLSLMIVFEIGYIIQTNVLKNGTEQKTESTTTPEPSELPVVGVTPQPENTQEPADIPQQ